jgi:hypothetical protein
VRNAREVWARIAFLGGALAAFARYVFGLRGAGASCLAGSRPKVALCAASRHFAPMDAQLNYRLSVGQLSTIESRGFSVRRVPGSCGQNAPARDSEAIESVIL